MDSRRKNFNDTLDISTSPAEQPTSPITTQPSSNRKRKHDDADFDTTQHEAKKQRLEKNRAYARKAREKKLAYIKKLEETTASQANEIDVLKNQVYQQTLDIIALSKRIRQLLLPVELHNCELFADYHPMHPLNQMVEEEGKSPFLATPQRLLDSAEIEKSTDDHPFLTDILEAPNLQSTTKQAAASNTGFFKPQSMKIMRSVTEEMDIGEEEIIEKPWEF